MSQKLPFEEILYDAHAVCWGRGNNAVGPQLLGIFQIREPNKKENARIKKDWEDAKQIYDKYINKGQRFKPWGLKANNTVTCKITAVNCAKQSVSWKQDNLTPDEAAKGYKPAAGKFSINAIIQLYRNNEIKFI